jgi:hypothetical protein
MLFYIGFANDLEFSAVKGAPMSSSGADAFAVFAGKTIAARDGCMSAG